MNIVVTIHQPNYLPYLGFFDKINKADIFVVYDDAQFTKEEYTHRNKIRIFHGWKWLTVPVEKKRIQINEIKIKNDIKIKNIKWQESHFRDIKDNYKNSMYFSKYEHELEAIYENKYERLVDLNLALINFLLDAFKIKTKFIFSSELGSNSKSTERLVEIVDALGGDTYLSGSSGRNYLNTNLFEKKDIQVQFQDYEHPVYDQQYEGFIPNMSAIDALFNIGKLEV